MRTAVFVQVRLSSTRLPRKALVELAGKCAIEHVMDALIRVPASVHALLTDQESVAELEPRARRCGFEVFAGDPDDVLSRYAAAARHWEIDRYYRATGDNPLVSARLAVELERRHRAADADFSGFLGPPLGTGVELVETEALLCADREAVDPYEREHVSPFIYRRPERFRVYRPWADDAVLLPDARVTLDTDEDQAFLERIFDELYRGEPGEPAEPAEPGEPGEPIEAEELVSWLKRHADTRRSDTDHDVLPCSKAG